MMMWTHSRCEFIKQSRIVPTNPDYSHPLMQLMIKGASARSIGGGSAGAQNSPYPLCESSRFRPLRRVSLRTELTRGTCGHGGADGQEVVHVWPARREPHDDAAGGGGPPGGNLYSPGPPGGGGNP